MSLRARLVLIAVLALAAVLAAVALVADNASRQVRAEIASVRDAYLLNTLRSAAETSLAIGLTLEQMGALQALIEREKAGAPQVFAIDVFSPAGILVYSTDRGMVGTPVAKAWTERLAQAGSWQLDAGNGERMLGSRFDNDLGAAAGGIVMTVPAATQGGPALAQWAALALDFALALAVSASLAALAAWLAMRWILRPFAGVAGVLQSGGPAHQEPLAAAALQARQAWQQAQLQLDDGMRQLRELDDAA